MGISLKSVKKNVEQRKLKYEMDMYTTAYGSLVICGLMFTPEEERPAQAEVNKTWRKLYKQLKKGNSPFPLLKDEDFIKKTLALFGMEVPEVFPIAMVQSSFNVLFAPYVDGNILPVREDGFYARTLESGKIYPIDFNKQENKEDAAI